MAKVLFCFPGYTILLTNFVINYLDPKFSTKLKSAWQFLLASTKLHRIIPPVDFFKTYILFNI